MKRIRVGRLEGSVPAATFREASRNTAHLSHSRNVAALGYNFSLDDRGRRDNRSIFLRDGKGGEGAAFLTRAYRSSLTNALAPPAGSFEVYQCPKRSGGH